MKRINKGDTVEYNGVKYTVLNINEGKCFCATATLQDETGAIVKAPVLPHTLKKI